MARIVSMRVQEGDMYGASQAFRHSPITNYERALREGGMTRSETIKSRLRALGLGNFALYSEEGRYLSRVIHDKEVIEGAVYGKAKVGFAMLVATNRRVIFLDIKPLSMNEQEVTYDIVGGVSHSRAGVVSIVKLSTSLGSYRIKTFNDRAALGFMEAIERQRVEHQERRKSHDYTAQER